MEFIAIINVPLGDGWNPSPSDEESLRLSLATCHSGEGRNPVRTANDFWMTDLACPQLDWGSGMTSEVVQYKIMLILINNFCTLRL